MTYICTKCDNIDFDTSIGRNAEYWLLPCYYCHCVVQHRMKLNRVCESIQAVFYRSKWFEYTWYTYQCGALPIPVLRILTWNKDCPLWVRQNVIFSIAWVETHENIVSVFRILYWNFNFCSVSKHIYLPLSSFIT